MKLRSCSSTRRPTTTGSVCAGGSDAACAAARAAAAAAASYSGGPMNDDAEAAGALAIAAGASAGVTACGWSITSCIATFTGPPGSSMRGSRLELISSALKQLSSGGKAAVRSSMWPSGLHNPIANRRSSCTARSNSFSNWCGRFARIASTTESDRALATTAPRLSRSRTNQRRVTRSTIGSTRYAVATTTTVSGSRKRSCNRIVCTIGQRRKAGPAFAGGIKVPGFRSLFKRMIHFSSATAGAASR
jgi:hypothetical protein